MEKLHDLRNALIAKQEEGQGMVEYSLILALVSIVGAAILGTLGTNIIAGFVTAANGLVLAAP